MKYTFRPSVNNMYVSVFRYYSIPDLILDFIANINENQKFTLYFRLFTVLPTIMKEPEHKTLIFSATKKRCDNLMRNLNREG